MGNLVMMMVESPANDLLSDDEYINGLLLSGVYLPEELLIVILSYVEPRHLLHCKLVCQLWNDIVKSPSLWHKICKRNNVQPKCLPWYLYYAKFATGIFDTNLIRNGNGQEKFMHWVVKPGFNGDGFAVETVPIYCKHLPENVEEFNGHESCFSTSFGACNKQQIIKFKNSSFMKHIFDKYKPKIVASEWFAPRCDCSSIYKLTVQIVQANKKFKSYEVGGSFEQWTDGSWKKEVIEISDYPDDIAYIAYTHEGQDQLFWKGYYGSKMAGACLKVLFDSIKEEQECPP